MSKVGEREQLTQQRVIRFFVDNLGYTYLGNWKDRANNRNIERGLLSNWLKRQGHSDLVVNRAVDALERAAVVAGVTSLYDANRTVYGLLRYGVKVLPGVGEQHVTVWPIDWENVANNDFAIAEEVTVAGENTKRPDLVLYVNGIALGVLELKRSIVSVSEGIRQNLDNQKKEFIRPFFATVQLVLAGNEPEGLRYGVIETPEKYYLRWKEAAGNGELTMENGELGMENGQRISHVVNSPLSTVNSPLSIELAALCRKERLLEIVHDFVVFDAGTKKTCRHNQYFGIRAAQAYVQRREGGIIWHTQGSGKSLTMVWLAKWIREHVTDARVVLITDRTELDEQIEKVFKGVSEEVYRTRSGADLAGVLNAGDEWLICSLIHKFGASEDLSERELQSYLEELRRSLPANFRAKGQIFVFVDECHRTQSGKLHQAMKTLLPNATFIGFTGTPLLKRDKGTSIEVFGPYIHTYKYDEAVRDGVVLDLRYEARDIDQSITSQAKVDQWFEAKTSGLTDYALAQLKQRWGTMQKVLSSRDRLSKIMGDILLDMETRPRLKSGYGNAILVSDDIYSACRFFDMFQQSPLAGKCAIVTSYKPLPANIKGEESGEGQTEEIQKYEIYRKMLAAHFDEPEDSAVRKVEQFETEVKERFIKEPGQMKLLIVVDKLLTGFDAPPATYLYIDKQMRDHGLFQAICRVNRLDGEDKEYGYVIDYKDLFKSLEKSIQDYTGEAFDGYDQADVDGLLKDRLAQGRERLEEAREAVKALCEPVEPPHDTAAYLRYFRGPDNDPATIKENEPRRVALYKLVGSLLRAYANLANEMTEAGYTPAEAQTIRNEVDHYEKVRQEVKLASGDYIDMKMYEPSMRYLLDAYIRAEESEKLSAFDDMTLVQLIVERGQDALDLLPAGLRADPGSMAETIENNVRRVILDEMAVNPVYYEKMSQLLDALIQARKQKAIEYAAYLARIVELTNQVRRPQTQTSYPAGITTPARQALYDNLKGAVNGVEAPSAAYAGTPQQDIAARLAIDIDDAIRRVKKADWRGHRVKRLEVRNAIKSVLGNADGLIDAIYQIVDAQREY